MKPQYQNEKTRSVLTLPRWAIPIVWAVIVLVIQILLPWAFAKIGPRFGWLMLSPSSWNYMGLIAVAVGLCLYAWCLVNHFGTYRDSVRVSFSPPHLVVSGPYVISRNPMYVSGLLTWLGWTVYFGSPTVLIALLLLWVMFAFRVIPHEEGLLEELFGEEYLEYKRTVHRWIGRK
jgi:protein-S-isoprenylcysteine O-methyltransferase Ste14